MLYEQDKKDYYGFDDDFFVVSDAKPIADSNLDSVVSVIDSLEDD